MEKMKGFVKEYTVAIMVIALCLLFTIGNPVFIRPNNIITILRQSAILGCCGIGIMFVMIAGGLNLAVGSYVSLVTVALAMLAVNFGMPWGIAMLIAIAMSTICGFLTGYVIVKTKIFPMIGSLAVSIVVNGIAYKICNGLPIYGIPQESKVFGQGYIGIIPIPVIIWGIIAVVAAFVLNKTYLGRWFFAAGSNDEAARLSGIQTQKIRILAYTISGFLAGIAGIIMYGRVGSGQPAAGSDVETNVLAAVVIGGVSFAGGEGKVTKACLGILMIALLTNGMTLNQIDDYTQMIVRGLIFLAAVVMDSIQHMPKKAKKGVKA